jgi:membrane-bound ClpP family serine protease
MYFLLNLIYKQQASSLVQTSSAIGQLGVVETSIAADAPGEVSLNVTGQYMTYIAKSAQGKAIPKGKTVKVVSHVGSELVVEEVNR